MIFVGTIQQNLDKIRVKYVLLEEKHKFVSLMTRI